MDTSDTITARTLVDIEWEHCEYMGEKEEKNLTASRMRLEYSIEVGQ